jgi:hypothetical protein
MMMDEETFMLFIRPHLPSSFSEHHELLLRICFGTKSPDPSLVEALSEESSDGENLKRMYYMVLVEFAASLGKGTKDSEETRTRDPEPHPYDVFYVETTIDNPRYHIAVCLPRRKQRNLFWYDGGSDLLPLKELSPKWRVASLAGPARVLENLSDIRDLSLRALCRESVHEATADVESLLASVATQNVIIRDLICALNDSQKQALATVLCPQFKDGFFAVQGPPGTGEKSLGCIDR